jgi:hypothetical protein
LVRRKSSGRSNLSGKERFRPLTEFGFIGINSKEHVQKDIEKKHCRENKECFKVIIKLSGDGIYSIYDSRNPSFVRGALDYISVLSILADIYGFTSNEVDNDTVEKIRCLNVGESVVLSYNG